MKKLSRLATDWRIQALPILGLAAIWGLHVVLTQRGDPLGKSFDIALWVVASALKSLSLAALAIILGQAYAAITGDVRRSRIAFAVWWVGLSSLVLLLAVTRDRWANVLSNDVTQYYSVPQALEAPESVEQHRAAWARDWAAGRVVAAEIALLAVLSAFHAWLGFRFGHRPSIAVPSAYATSALILAAYLWLSPWTLWSYDLFHGDILPGALLADGLFFIVATDPYTTIAIPGYLTLFGCGVLIPLLGSRVGAFDDAELP